MSHEIKSLIKI